LVLLGAQLATRVNNVGAARRGSDAAAAVWRVLQQQQQQQQQQQLARSNWTTVCSLHAGARQHGGCCVGEWLLCGWQLVFWLGEPAQLEICTCSAPQPALDTLVLQHAVHVAASILRNLSRMTVCLSNAID
jgi:hypothetical protein